MIKRLINWWKALFSWKIIRETGVWVYEENTVTGTRRALRVSSAYQPIDFSMIREGDWVIGQGSGRVVRQRQ
jgi:hypothetical protein